MKRTMIFIAIVLLSGSAFSQTTTLATQEKDSKPKSKIELFSDKAGAMLKKEFIPLGTLRNTQFQVLKITDLSTNEAQSGLRLYTPGAVGSVSTSSVAYLDADELAGFIKAVDYVTQNVANTPAPENDVEYNYESRSGLRFGIFNSAAIFSSKKKWSVILRPEKFYASATGYFTTDDLPKMKELLEQAKSKL
jgi:hypothetical protein